MKYAAIVGLLIAAGIAAFVIFKTTTGPTGIKAICMDGSISMSKHNKGTCSKHGGIDKWVNE